MTTRHDWMMRLYDLALEIDDFVTDPSDDALKSLWERAMGYKIDIDLELDVGPDEEEENIDIELDDTQRELDTDDSNDGEALASAGFGTDEDYGGTDDRA
mgnify:FL=1